MFALGTQSTTMLCTLERSEIIYRSATLHYYISSKTKNDNVNVPMQINKYQNGIWHSKTTLIIGDSIISGIIDNKMNIRDKKVKAQSFPGTIII